MNTTNNILGKSGIFLLLLVPLLQSCTKEMEIDVKNAEKKIVVQCLFSDEESWDVIILTTKGLIDDSDKYIDNATVEIRSGSTSIFLDSEGDGHYESSQKPVPGEIYELRVNVPGYEEVRAQSSIPVSVEALAKDFEINWLTYMYPNDLTDYDAFPVTILFEKPIQNANIIFRAKLFNPQYGYKRYLLSSQSLKKLEGQGIPAVSVTRLEKIVDKWQTDTEIFSDCFNGTGTMAEELNYYNWLRKELQEKTVKQREYDAFYSTECFANDEWLSNISYDTRNVFGQKQSVQQAGLLYADPNLKYYMEEHYSGSDKREYWVEVVQASPEYYEYYRTYILQVSQRMNPYSEPVEVYTNVRNGVGVFAGYQRQMIHLLTY
jgi:hypothetical protein